MMTRENRIKGALYGFAIGDAMGATTEFMSESEIARVHGKVTDIIGGGWLGIKAGRITDDTQMTLCVCEAIKRFPRNTKLMLNRCCENFTTWYLSKPIDIGNACRRVIAECKTTNNHEIWIEVAKNPDSLGNGSLMRTMPIVLAGLGEETAIQQGQLTHNNNTCNITILLYYKVLSNILEKGVSIFEPEEKLHEPTGHVVHTFDNSMYWLLHTDNFEDAIIKAVNHGGDADTIAAVTGSLAGALYGYDAIPKRWIDQLDPVIKIMLDEYAEFFTKKVCTK